MGEVIQIDEARIRDHLGEMVRGIVECGPMQIGSCEHMRIRLSQSSVDVALM